MIRDSQFSPVFGLETALNRCIRESSRAQDLLASLDGRSLAVSVRGLDTCVRLDAAATHLALSMASAGDDPPANATLEGTPLTLLGLIGASSAEDLRASGAGLAGDAQTAEAFAELLRHARPDWEEELSKLVGDIPAHGIARKVRRTDAWVRRAGTAAVANTSEFLQEEARQLPPRTEIDAFNRSVDRLRDDIERAAQRLDRLESLRSPQAVPDTARDGLRQPVPGVALDGTPKRG